MQIQNRLDAWRKLSVKNLCLILGINLLTPIISCGSIYFIVDIQIKQHLLESVPEYYYLKMILLALSLNVILLSVLDYYMIIIPMVHLEETISEYKELAQTKTNIGHNKHWAKSGLEQSFLDILADQKKIELQAKEKESQIQTTELYALQTQINPHFLYNTLDSIRGYALLHHVDKIADMTEALSRLFRSMIAREGKTLLLREELENVENYMIIQNFRFKKKFSYECDIPQAIVDGYMIPNMTVQPVVENAIMHGLERKYGKGKINVSGYVTEKRLVITVTDNGVGIEGDKLNYLNKRMLAYQTKDDRENEKYGVGIALMNINKRIKLTFGEEFGIHIFSTPGISTATELTLPALPAKPEG